MSEHPSCHLGVKRLVTKTVSSASYNKLIHHMTGEVHNKSTHLDKFHMTRLACVTSRYEETHHETGKDFTGVRGAASRVNLSNSTTSVPGVRVRVSVSLASRLANSSPALHT